MQVEYLEVAYLYDMEGYQVKWSELILFESCFCYAFLHIFILWPMTPHKIQIKVLNILIGQKTLYIWFKAQFWQFVRYTEFSDLNGRHLLENWYVW